MLVTTKMEIAKTDTRNKEVVMQWLANEVESGRLIPPERKFDIGGIDISKDKRIERETWWTDYEFARSDRF